MTKDPTPKPLAIGAVRTLVGVDPATGEVTLRQNWLLCSCGARYRCGPEDPRLPDRCPRCDAPFRE